MPPTHKLSDEARRPEQRPASLVERDISIGLVAIKDVSGLINELFFENKAHKDAVAVFRDTLERERELSSRQLQETNMTLDAWRTQFAAVEEQNRRLRHLGTLALRHLQETERRAQEAESLLREVSTTIGPKTIAFIDSIRRVKRGMRRFAAFLRDLFIARPLRFFSDIRRRAAVLMSRIFARRRDRATAE